MSSGPEWLLRRLVTVAAVAAVAVTAACSKPVAGQAHTAPETSSPPSSAAPETPGADDEDLGVPLEPVGEPELSGTSLIYSYETGVVGEPKVSVKEVYSVPNPAVTFSIVDQQPPVGSIVAYSLVDTNGKKTRATLPDDGNKLVVGCGAALAVDVNILVDDSRSPGSMGDKRDYALSGTVTCNSDTAVFSPV